MSKQSETSARRRFVKAVAAASVTGVLPARECAAAASDSSLASLADELGLGEISAPLWAKLQTELDELQVRDLLAAQEVRMRRRIAGLDGRSSVALAAAEDHWSGKVLTVKGLHLSEIEVALIATAASGISRSTA